MTDEPEHLDPNHLPLWLAEAAAKTHPEAMGWLAAGYLAGVQVGKKTGPCMATLDLMPIGVSADDVRLAPLFCELGHGHVGGHSNGLGAKWIDVPPDPASPPPGADPALASELSPGG